MKTVNNISVRETLEEMVAAPVAVVVVDVQNDFCLPDGHFGRHGKDMSTAMAAVPHVVSFVGEAQSLGIPCIFIRQRTEPRGMSDSPAWLRLKTRDGKSPDYTLPGTWGSELVAGLAPAAQDLVVEKYRPDAFLATPLDALLRARGIEALVLVGTTTEGCLESTVRSASYHDYYVTIAGDLVFSPNRELHEGSLRFMKQRYLVAPSASVLDAWRAR